MDKQSLIILAVIAFAAVAAMLIYLFSGERLSKKIRSGDIDSVAVTCRRKTNIFPDDSGASLCAAAGKIRLSRFALRDNSVNSKIGGNFFVTFKYKDGTALDLCFNGDFTACRVGTAEWRRVINPKDAARLEHEQDFLLSQRQ